MTPNEVQAVHHGLRQAEQRIDAACRAAGRARDEVALLPVTKTVSPAAVRAAVDAGYSAFGENRVQEAVDKAEALADCGIRWHMIGHLQRNKVKQALGFADCIQSVDREPLVERLADQLDARGERRRVLVQVNTSGAASQFGVVPDEAPALARAVAQRPSLELHGLMTIGRLVDNPEDARDCFRTLRQLRDQLVAALGQPLPELSMGMSGDLEVAVDEGATLVRIGSAIFGARQAQ